MGSAPTASIVTAAITEMFPFATRCTGGAIGDNAAPAIVHLVFNIRFKETKNNAVT
jgi:hypothetical protein